MVTTTFKNGSDRSDQLHVLACYVPTYAASREEKDEYFDTFQQAIPDIPPRENLVLLGDLNACVGSRLDEDEWWHIKGPHGFGELTDAGRSCQTSSPSMKPHCVTAGFRRELSTSKPVSTQSPSSVAALTMLQ